MNMSQPELYQDLVLGSGAGGKLLAWHLASTGRRVAVIERRWIGGSCPNIACLPSKNEIWTAKVADFLRQTTSPRPAADFYSSAQLVSCGTTVFKGGKVPLRAVNDYLELSCGALR
jgi:hypothetical protein